MPFVVELNYDQKSKRVFDKKKTKKISLSNHPLYSPDLSPCDYFLFPKLKTNMKGLFYEDIPAILPAVIGMLKNIPINDINNLCMHCFSVLNVVLSLEEIILKKMHLKIIYVMCILFHIQKLWLFLKHTLYQRQC